ncbi:hypothetical protein, partial [Escherichia coli]
LFSITAVLGCLAFIWAVAYILQHANGKVGNSSEYKRDSQYVSGVQLRNGNQGYGYYYGFIRVDDEQK